MVGESDILQISSATMITKKAQTACILSLGVSKYFCPKHMKIFFFPRKQNEINAKIRGYGYCV